jgi:hypothetical protein
MEWTVEDYAHASHNPVVEVNGRPGSAPIEIDATVGQPILLDASRSSDPDRRGLHFHWFHYAEAGSADGNLAAVTLTNAETVRAVVRADAVCRPAWLPLIPCNGTGTAHIILAVTGEGAHPLTSYRRIILHVHKASPQDPAIVGKSGD